MKVLKFSIGLWALLALLCTACGDDDDDNDTVTDYTELKSDVQTTYANIVYYNYLDSHTDAVALQSSLTTFVNDPTEDNFNAAKEAWLTARESYGQTEAYRFASGPIDDEDGPEGLLNAWPLDESYIDYVEGAENAGIINDATNYPTLSADLLISLNEAGGEENVSMGYHAIEFLLWGQDLTSPSAIQAGQRAYTDFVDGGTASNQDRRRQYLSLCADLLVEHLATLVDEWDINGSGNYRTTFLALDEDDALKNILTGIGVLAKSELAGERIFTAYDNQDQEDEHSCFSDNTHRDTRLNAKGVQNVYTGSYTRTNGTVISGTSIADLMDEVNADFSAEVSTQLTTAINAVEATAIPFDNAITDTSTRPDILTAVNELRDLGDKIAEVGSELGITINTALPE